MDFDFDARTEELRAQLLDFMDAHVYPAEPVFEEQAAALENQWDRPPVIDVLKAEARRRGLWNLFLPDQRFGRGTHQPPVRTARRDHRVEPDDRARGHQLRGA